MADTLNSPPIRSQVVDDGGRMTQPWAAWFTVLYRRIGEALGRSTTAIDADVSTVLSGAGSLELRVSILETAAPNPFPTYTVATVPAAAGHAGKTIFVSDEAGGAVLAFSDGTDWRRVTDRAVIS